MANLIGSSRLNACVQTINARKQFPNLNFRNSKTHTRVWIRRQ